MGRELKPLRLEGVHKALPHSLFRFPGKLHPPLVNQIMAQHPEANYWMDSMAGCGTVPLTTVTAGHNGLFGDIDPLSCLITRAKTNPLPGEELCSQMNDILSNSSIDQSQQIDAITLEKTIQTLEATRFAAPKNLVHWFEPKVAHHIAKFLISLDDHLDSLSPQMSDALQAILASSVRRLSRADPTPVSCLGVTKVRLRELEAGINFNVEAKLRTKTKYLANCYDYMLSLESLGTATVVNSDAKSWGATAKKLGVAGDVAITSPPYCHAIEYWRRHELEFSWLNLVNQSEKSSYRKSFVGTTTLHSSSPSSDALPGKLETLVNKVGENGGIKAGKLIRQYFSDIQVWLESYVEAMVPGGTIYVISGANNVRGVKIDTPQTIELLASEMGLEVRRKNDFLYENTVMQYPTSHGHRVGGESITSIACP